MKALSNNQRIQRRSATGGSLLTVTVMVALLALLLTAGCAQSPPARQAMEDQQQQNEELQKQTDKLEKQKAAEKKEDLQKQIDDLKAQQEEQAKKQEEQNQNPQIVIENNENIASAPAQAPEGVVAVSPDVSTSTDLEAGALNAAANYYAAVEAGDYTYTYNALSAADQDYYTYDEWQNANTALDSAASEFEVFRALVDSPNTAMVEGGYPHVADVGVTIYYPDGSTGTRYTFFVYEDGVWKHWLTSEETELFDSVFSSSATATATPTASETTTTQSASSGGEACTLQGTLVRPWEGAVAPDTPHGVKPCMAKDGSFRLYIPLMDANPMQLYLQGANEGDYDLMYDQLNSQAQTWYTREQWDAAMQKLHTGDNTYEWVGSRITTFRVDPANSGYSWIRENNAKYMQFYQAEILVTYPDGSQETVYRSWIGGYWKQSEKQDGMGIILTLNQVKAIDGALGIHTYVG